MPVQPREGRSDDTRSLDPDAKRKGPTLRDVLDHPEEHPEEAERLRESLARITESQREHWNKVLQPVMQSIAESAASGLSEGLLKSVQIPAIAELSKQMSRQIEAIARKAIPSLPLPRVETARLFSVSPSRVSQIAGAPTHTRPSELTAASSLEARSVIKAAEVQWSSEEILVLIERLADLHGRKVLTDEEFVTKKAELLARL